MSRIVFPDEEAEYFFVEQQEGKRREPSHHFVALIAALLNTLVLAVGWWKANSLAFKVFLGLAAAYLSWIIGKYALRGIRWLSIRIRNRRIVAAEQIKLEEMFTRFKKFVKENQSGSFRNIIRYSTPYRIEVLDDIFESDYIPSWVISFDEQIRYPPASVTAFFMRCREFSLLVKEFHISYVVRTQKGTWKSTKELLEACIEQLDAFREEYNSYLRDFEKWSAAVGIQARKIWAETPVYMRVLPYTSIDRLTKSFRKTKAAE
jgi:hypothetical protein